MNNHQGYGVWWDVEDAITGLQVKHHRYFSTWSGARLFADSLNNNAKVQERALMSDEQMDSAERDLVAKANRDELTRLMLQYGFTIKAKDFPNWRPTKRSSGNVPGVWETVEIIATDGLLGIYIPDFNENKEPLVGHIQMFTGKVEPLFSITVSAQGVPKPKKAKQKSRRQQLLEQI